MIKKNLIGIVMVILIAAAFIIGYEMGKSASGGKVSSTGQPAAGINQNKGTASLNKAPVKPETTSDKKKDDALKNEPSILQTFYGTVIPHDEANVQSEQGGTIVLLKSEVGDTVKKNDILVRLDNSDRLLELEKAKSSKISLQQQLEQATSNYNTVQKDFDRNKSLFEEGHISRKDLENSTNQLQTALTSLQNARENVSQADTQIRITENAINNYIVKASISGIIDSKSYNLKEVYRSGEVIYHIINIDYIYAQIEVPETYLSKIKEEMKVPVSFSALDDTKFQGVIETILPSSANDNRNFTAKVLVANKDHRIKPGMFARVDILKGPDRT